MSASEIGDADVSILQSLRLVVIRQTTFAGKEWIITKAGRDAIAPPAGAAIAESTDEIPWKLWVRWRCRNCGREGDSRYRLMANGKARSCSACDGEREQIGEPYPLEAVTPEMIKAGIAALSVTTEGKVWVYENIVATVYRAMRELEPAGRGDG